MFFRSAYYGIMASVIGGVAGYLCTILVEAATTGTLRLAPVPVVPILEASALAIAACLLATCVPLGRISRMSVVGAIGGVE